MFYSAKISLQNLDKKDIQKELSYKKLLYVLSFLYTLFLYANLINLYTQ